MKVRVGFVSNSSSTSFIVIDASRGYNTYIPNGNENVFGFEGTTEFGWGPEEITDIESKINFCYLQASYLSNDRITFKKGQSIKGTKRTPTRIKALSMLRDVIKEETGIEDINWYINDDDLYSNKKRYGYIDHQASAEEGMNLEMFENKQKLKDFIFGKDSYIKLDNDNYDDYAW